MHRLPHKSPVRFVTSCLIDNELDARTVVEFPYTPTLPMLVEAAAQSSVFMYLSEIKRGLGIDPDAMARGMLLKMKATQHRKMAGLSAEIAVNYVANYEHFFEMTFQVIEDGECISEGEMNILLFGDDDE